jgi:hypothetical protein
MKQNIGMLENARKFPTEEIVLILQAMRFTFTKPKDAQSALEFATLVKELLNFFDNNKKTTARVAVIQTLDRMVSKLDFSSPQELLHSGEAKLWEIVMELHKKAKKWANITELTPASLSFIATLLSNAPIDYFNMQFEVYIQSDLISKKVKDYVYDCCLKLLKGRYACDNFKRAFNALHHTTMNGEVFSCLMRQKNELENVAMLGRLQLIAEILFLSKTQPIEPMSLDVCSDVLLQICAHKYVFFKKTKFLKNRKLLLVSIMDLN